MISLFRLPNDQMNNPVSYLHIRISMKLSTKNARIGSHFFLAVTQTLQQTEGVQTLGIVHANEEQPSHLYTSLFPEQCNVVIMTVNGGPVRLSYTGPW